MIPSGRNQLPSSNHIKVFKLERENFSLNAHDNGAIFFNLILYPIHKFTQRKARREIEVTWKTHTFDDFN